MRLGSQWTQITKALTGLDKEFRLIDSKVCQKVLKAMAQSVCLIGSNPGLSTEGGLEGVGKMGSSQEEVEQCR